MVTYKVSLDISNGHEKEERFHNTVASGAY